MLATSKYCLNLMLLLEEVLALGSSKHSPSDSVSMRLPVQLHVVVLVAVVVAAASHCSKLLRTVKSEMVKCTLEASGAACQKSVRWKSHACRILSRAGYKIMKEL